MATDMIARAIAMSKADLVDGKVPASELPEISIGSLSDTAVEEPETGEVLKYDADQGKWINGTASGGGGTSDYTDLTNKPKINNVTLSGNKSLSDIGAAAASETYTETEVDTLLAGKVDKVDGKGLSTNDFTDAEKTKLSGVESGAEVNVQSDWEQSDDTADDYIKNKPTIPAAQVNSDWNAASGIAQILNKPTLGTAAAKGVDASPTASSTNLVESGGVASALAGKQDTLAPAQQAAADSGITSAKVTQYDKDSAALPQILNSGTKNLFNVTKETTTQYGVTFTNNGDGTVTSSGTLDEGKTETYLSIGAVDLPAGDYVFTCADGASFSGYDSYVYVSGSDPLRTIARDIDGYNDFTLTEPTRVVVRIRVRAGHEAATFRPMICTKAMSDISGAFEPYAPTNRELYEMILALQA